MNLFPAGPFIRGMRFSGPNLAPLLDVMFVLLLFLMLGVDFTGRVQEPLTLPEARSIRECKEMCCVDRLTINAHHRDDRACSGLCRVDEHWMLSVKGRDCTDPPVLRSMLVSEAVKGRRCGLLRDRRIIVRSDAGAPSWLPQRAMNACAMLGFQRVYVAARRPRL